MVLCRFPKPNQGTGSQRATLSHRASARGTSAVQPQVRRHDRAASFGPPTKCRVEDSAASQSLRCRVLSSRIHRDGAASVKGTQEFLALLAPLVSHGFGKKFLGAPPMTPARPPLRNRHQLFRSEKIGPFGKRLQRHKVPARAANCGSRELFSDFSRQGEFQMLESI